MDILKDNKYSQTRAVYSIVKHPEYIKNVARNDIAVIYLTDPVELNKNVKVAEIAPRRRNFEGKTCVIAGWGNSEEFKEDVSPYLREAFLKVIPNDECDKYQWFEPITQKQICGFDQSKSPEYRARTCKGDSGGALMCGVNYRYLAGVSSVGGKGCSGKMPSLLTRVSEYKDWIDEA